MRKSKLRFGMIGGGRGAFIGGVHRLVAAMDGEAELVAGAFSSDPERSRASGADLGLDPQRVYADFAAMAEAFGVKGICCTRKEDVPKTVDLMLSHDGPVVVDFKVEPNEHVYPMVPSGKGLHEMELGTLA